jgi:hypothetical protein
MTPAADRDQYRKGDLDPGTAEGARHGVPSRESPLDGSYPAQRVTGSRG